MALRFLYLAFCAVLRILVRRRREAAYEAEIVILRHEVAVLRRTAGRAPRSTPSSRAKGSARSSPQSERRSRTPMPNCLYSEWGSGGGPFVVVDESAEAVASLDWAWSSPATVDMVSSEPRTPHTEKTTYHAGAQPGTLHYESTIRVARAPSNPCVVS